MTHTLSRREQKALRKAGGRNKPAITVNTGGVRAGLVYMVSNLIAVFVFPFWMIWQGYVEWREERRRG